LSCETDEPNWIEHRQEATAPKEGKSKQF